MKRHERSRLIFLLSMCKLLAVTAASARDGHDQVPLDRAIAIEADPGSSQSPTLVMVCHRPPGGHAATRTIQVPPQAVSLHLAHGDELGACGAAEWTATTIVGALDVEATAFGLGRPSGVDIDGAGRIYIADYANHRVERLDGTTLTRIAGTGVVGSGGDGGPATAALLSSPSDIAFDGQGRLYIADGNNNCVRRVDTAGIITTFAGVCGTAFTYYVPGTNNTGDGGPVSAATFAGPVSVAIDAVGRVYILDSFNGVVRRVDENGIIERVAGTGNSGMGGDGGPATSADLNGPSCVFVDAAGALYIADTSNYAIRKVEHPGPPSQPGTIHTVAGVLGEPGLDPDGPVATTRFYAPSSVAVDANGVLTIADYATNRILQVVGSDVATIAGSSMGFPGFSGDGGPAASATLQLPADVAVDATGRIVIADTYNDRIRRVDVDVNRTIDTIAGSGAFGVDGDEAAATSARHLNATGIATDAEGNVYVADGYDRFVGGDSRGRVRRVDTGGTISTLSGIEDIDDSPFPFPEGVAVDSQGRVYVVGVDSGIVWRADASEIVRIAGGGTSTAEGALATDADLGGARTIAFDSMDRLYVSLTYALPGTIRRVDTPNGTSGTVVTVVGGGSDPGDTTGPGAPLRARLSDPHGIGFDANDRLYIGDAGADRIVRVDFAVPSLTRIAGGEGNTQIGENVPPLQARIDPDTLAVDADGNVYFNELAGHRVRRVDAGLTAVTTVAGSQARQHGDFGDGGPATGSVDVTRMLAPQAVAIDPQGRLLIAETSNHRVRRVDADGIITTIAGEVSPEGMGQLAQARLADPLALAFTDGMTFVAGGSSGTVQAVRGDFVDAVIGRYPQTQSTGDLARFRDRSFGAVSGIAADPTSSTLYVVESNRIQAVAMSPPDDSDKWTIAPFANASGTAGYADGDIATAAFRSPGGLHHDGSTLYAADTGNHVIRQISGGTVTTIAGRPEQSGFGGDGGPALDALLDRPHAITKCANGDVFVADTANDRVRRIHEGTISTVAAVESPKGLACDAAGNVYASSNDTVRQLPAVNGVVDGTEPARTIYGPSKYACLTGVVLLDSDTLRVADQCTGVLLELQRQSP